MPKPKDRSSKASDAPTYKRPRRRKSCWFCAQKVELLSYQEVQNFRKFVSDRGKINKRAQTGVCAKHQRQLARAVKRARVIGIVPYAVD